MAASGCGVSPALTGCRQLVRFEIIDVNAAQTALFGFHQECGLHVVNDATRQRLFRQFIQSGNGRFLAVGGSSG